MVATTSEAARPLEGSMGLPVLGETLSFIKQPFDFVEQRVARYGPAFKTHLLFRKTVVITGADAAEAFIDPRNCRRRGSMPYQVLEMFAGTSLPTMDGAPHRARKQIVLAGVGREALESFLPTMQSAIEKSLDGLAARGQGPFLGELKRLSFEVIARTIAGLDDPDAIGRLIADYNLVLRGIPAAPVKLPFTTFGRAVKARDRIMATLLQLVREHRAEKREDGLARILDFAAEDGTRIADDEAARELHHIFLAGYIIYTVFAMTMIQLSQHPEVRDRVRAEVLNAAASGPLALAALMHMQDLMHVVLEVKRLTPVIPGIFAVADRDFEFAGKRIPAGWTVMWAIRPTVRDAAVFQKPDDFDPARFGADRAEHERHPHAYSPQGAGPLTGHRCAGMDFSTQFMQAFTALLLRGYDWELPEQDLRLDAQIPPEPRDGLVARLTRRPAA